MPPRGTPTTRAVSEIENQLTGDFSGLVKDSQRRRQMARNKVLAQARYAEAASRLRKIKSERGCEDCHEPTRPHELHFHHRDPATKLFNVSYGAMLAPERLEAEIAKCDVLCASCHRARHSTTPGP